VCFIENETMTEEMKTVLIVDDSPENISVLGEVLKPYYRRLVATSGEKALQLIENGRKPDLILLDIMMPGIDGYETCRRLKDNEDTKNIPVIFVSAKSEESDEAMGFTLGAVDYITKPIKPLRLLARIKTHLKQEKMRRQLRAQNKELLATQRLRDDIEHISRHDIKNPLAIVIGGPGFILMDDSNLTEVQIQQLKNIEASGYRILEMVDRSLDLLKLEQGTYQFQPGRVDIGKTLKAISRDLFHDFENNSVRFDVAFDDGSENNPKEFVIFGEELLTYSLLVNLVRNALEASPDERVVTVNVKEVEDTIAITVHNDGEIPESIKDTFFDKYVTCGKIKGTGIGTYSASLQTKMQKGQISFTTSQASGTTLKVALRAYRDTDN
jgi:two-component system sensor histidine kinase/response regulator